MRSSLAQQVGRQRVAADPCVRTWQCMRLHLVTWDCKIAVQELVHRSRWHFQTGSPSLPVHACSYCQVGVECAACESGGSQAHTHASK